MSRLDELINELCPDGVEFRALSDVFEMKNGYTPSKKNADFWTDGTIPWFRIDDIRINGRILSDSMQHITPQAVKGGKLFPADSIIMSTSATIGEHALIRVDSLVNQRFTVFTKRKSLNLELDMMFVFYYFFVIGEWCKNNVNVSSFPSVDMDKLRKYEIPLPPLPVQSEIVRILDKFTELTSLLSAELTARRKQYEYYRDKLLTFGANDVKWMRISDLYDFKNGLNKEKKYFGKGTPIVNFTDVYNHRWMTKDTLKGLVEVSEKESALFSAKKGDIFFTRTSETVKDIGMVSALLDDIDNCVFSGFVLRAHPKTELLLPKFTAYYCSSYNARKEIIRYCTCTTRALTSGPRLGRILMPVPPLPVQARIVSILDRFDSLCNDITAGLPAEIASREKQYSYYRDRLLSFKRRAK